jgi:hypothetical protein
VFAGGVNADGPVNPPCWAKAVVAATDNIKQQTKKRVYFFISIPP